MEETDVFKLSSYDGLIEKLQELVIDDNPRAFSLYIEGDLIELREEKLT